MGGCTNFLTFALFPMDLLGAAKIHNFCTILHTCECLKFAFFSYAFAENRKDPQKFASLREGRGVMQVEMAQC